MSKYKISAAVRTNGVPKMTHDELLERFYTAADVIGWRECTLMAADALREVHAERDHEKWLRDRAEDFSSTIADQRDEWKHKAELYEKALLDRHGGECISLLEELDTARAERDAAIREIGPTHKELVRLRALLERARQDVEDRRDESCSCEYCVARVALLADIEEALGK